MRRLIFFIGALAIATMVGCAKPLDIDIFTNRPVTPEQIDELVAQEEYGDALDLLDDIPETHPQYALLQQKLADVKKRAAAHEKTVLKNMRAAIDTGNWFGALDEVDTGLDKLPSSTLLKQGREELLKRRAQRIEELETEMLIAKGKWLAHDAPLRDQLAHVDSQNLIDKWKLSRKKSEVEDTAEELYECSKRAIDKNKFKQARTCLTLAEHLDSSRAMQAAVRELREKLAEREKKAQRVNKKKLSRQAKKALNKDELQRARQIVAKLVEIDPDDREIRQLQKRLNTKLRRAQEEKLQRAYERLAKQAKEALDKGELQRARQIVPKLAQINPDNPEVQQLQHRLDKIVAAQVNTMLKRGSRLYRRERIAEAKKVWEEVLELDPSNKQAQAGVKRAERVLERLRQLEEQDKSILEYYP